MFVAFEAFKITVPSLDLVIIYTALRCVNTLGLLAKFYPLLTIIKKG